MFASSVEAKYTFQFAALLLSPEPSSLSAASAPYQTTARLPGRSPVSIQGMTDAEGAGRSLTRTGCDQVMPWSSECTR